MDKSSAYSPNCDEQVLMVRKTPNHILHFLITIVTCGVWLIVWISIASEKKPWRCSRCGEKLGGGSNGWGLVGAAFATQPQKKGPEKGSCPFCKESVHKDAVFCKHCHQTIRAAE